MLKKLVSLLFAINSITAAAVTYDYELIHYSNGSYRTEDEILKETNTTVSELESYKCENQSRFELFTESLTMNMAMDSLRIKDKGKEYYFLNSAFYELSGSKVRKVRGAFLRTVLRNLTRLERLPNGRIILEKLQKSEKPFYVKFGRSSFMPNYDGEKLYLRGNNAGFVSIMDELRPLVEGLPFDTIGSAGTIFWNPNMKSKFMESDMVERMIDPLLVLAHEMFHAYDGMRGLLDRRMVVSEELEGSPVSEYRAVFFENTIRREIGRKYRRFYSYSEGATKDMLDDNNEPILLPTPCIRWL